MTVARVACTGDEILPHIMTILGALFPLFQARDVCRCETCWIQLTPRRLCFAYSNCLMCVTMPAVLSAALWPSIRAKSQLHRCHCRRCSQVPDPLVVQILPHLVQSLPLQADFEENNTVFSFICSAYFGAQQLVCRSCALVEQLALFA